MLKHTSFRRNATVLMATSFLACFYTEIASKFSYAFIQIIITMVAQSFA